MPFDVISALLRFMKQQPIGIPERHCCRDQAAAIAAGMPLLQLEALGIRQGSAICTFHG